MAKLSQRFSKRTIIIAGIVLLLIIALLLFFFFSGSNTADQVYVMSVGEITGADITGTASRFSGVVESQETLDINIESGRTIDEIYVEAGQTVAVGDKLFSYDNSDIGLQLSQISLDIERMQSTISTSRDEISLLEKERQHAPSDSQLDYTLQIQSLQAEIKQTEYNMRAKQLEYDQLKKKYDNSVIVATMAGSIKTINDPNNAGGGGDYGGTPSAFMVIMKSGDYMIKGTVTELNVQMLNVDMPVLIRSRTDVSQTWKGYISNIDTSQPVDENNNGNYYYDGYNSGGGESASKYAFYINMDSAEGLMMGQHVTIEPDYGQAEGGDALFLGSFYIIDADVEGGAYVWAANASDRLEKRSVTLGEYNAELDTYEVLDGLTIEDYIAFPEEGLKRGMKTTKEFIVDEPGLEDPGFDQPGFEDPDYEKPVDDGDGTQEALPPDGTDDSDMTDKRE